MAMWLKDEELPRYVFQTQRLSIKLLDFLGFSDIAALGGALKALVPNCRVVATKRKKQLQIAGGTDGASHWGSSESMDPLASGVAGGVWVPLQAKPLEPGRSFAAGGAVAGKLYMCGGWDGYSFVSSAFCFDPIKNSWVPQPPMRIARGSAAGAVLNGRLYICGGRSGGPTQEDLSRLPERVYFPDNDITEEIKKYTPAIARFKRYEEEVPVRENYEKAYRKALKYWKAKLKGFQMEVLKDVEKMKREEHKLVARQARAAFEEAVAGGVTIESLSKGISMCIVRIKMCERFKPVPVPLVSARLREIGTEGVIPEPPRGPNEEYYAECEEEVFHGVVEELRATGVLPEPPGPPLQIGGPHERDVYLDLVERYDPIEEQWEMLPPMLEVRSSASAGRLHGKLYCSRLRIDGRHMCGVCCCVCVAFL
eukprot:TRINITY_DN24722_c0_g1_i4.p1 TRINITY_DN24722_c0_g1~~TRINITY_DN24722_c0_g1_i4.p1  ORF type:complete len:424 (+),score=85.75 TRINITY_DN24722_c0_g1_i4:74-1345(+)